MVWMGRRHWLRSDQRRCWAGAVEELVAESSNIAQVECVSMLVQSPACRVSLLVDNDMDWIAYL